MIQKSDGVSRAFVFASVGFGSVALLLACVGIGTPNWQSNKVVINGTTYTNSTANFFYACFFTGNRDSLSCQSRSPGTDALYYYPIDSNQNATDFNSRLNNAAGLSIVGLILIFSGTITTLVMIFLNLPSWVLCVPPAILFTACLFMLAGMAEGARVLYYNDYAANLYQTSHLLTMLSLLLSSMAAGRMHFQAQLMPNPASIRRP